MRNTNKFLPLYTPGAKPVFIENDTFTTIIPLIFVSLLTYAQQLTLWLGLSNDALPHLQKGLANISLPVSLKDASWKDVLLHLVLSWHEKGTNLPILDWPDNHLFAKLIYTNPPFTQDKSTNLTNTVSDGKTITVSGNKTIEGTNPLDSNSTVIQLLSLIGIEQVPTWHEISTNFIHKKVVYLISILSLSSEPISLSDLMRYMNYANRKTFRDNYLSPLRQTGFIDLTIPEKINDPDQKYFLTESGKAFLSGLIQ